MLNEFTKEEINRDTCKSCQCSTCTNKECPVPCKAHIPCMAAVVNCGEHKTKGEGI